MKLSNYIIPTLLLLAIAVVSCELRDDGNRVADITLEQTSATLDVGENLQLSAILTPADVANPNIIWSSSNTGVATVLNGVVTAVSDGTATVTATTQDGGHIATSAVTVRTPPPPPEPDVSVTGVIVSPTTAELAIGGTRRLTATTLPSNATNQNVTWESSDNSIATVDNDGLVTAVAEGSATITVTTVDGGYTADSEITVTIPPPLPMTGCNTATPGWGAGGLGVISWGTIGNTNPQTGSTSVSRTGSVPTAITTSPQAANNTQVWTGAVFASACQKTTFAGGYTGSFNADCRSANTNLTGHFFSWCAVMRFADVLCPSPWRVPTADDFRVLHWILTNQTPPTPGSSVAMIANTYMGTAGGTAGHPQLGGTWGGASYTGISGLPFLPYSHYWSSTEVNATNARNLFFDGSNVRPEFSSTKAVGFVLRCVRNP